MKRFLLSIFLLTVFFSVEAQSVTVIQPNGGEVLYGCQNYQIQWNATGVTNNWNIDYSLNNGAIWTSVASNLNVLPLSSTYSYDWSVPMVSSSTVLVRVRDYSDTAKQDQSNAVFTIQLPINVTSPNGGEVWQGLSSQTISWNPAGTSGFFNLYYSVNNGSSWSTIVTNIAANNYTWTVPNTPSSQALVRVTDATTSCQLDISNAVFEISPAQPILTSPNGGEVWQINSSKNITWTSSTFHSNVKLEYSIDNGFSYNLITNSTSNDGSHPWVIPNTPSEQVLIKASNTSGSSVFDVSDAPFTINLPTPLLTYPNGGETLRSGNTYSVTWNSSTVASNVQLQYSLNNGTSWGTITNSTTNNGTRSWVIPKVATTTEALVRIINTSFPSAIDTSDAVFTILAPITIYNPVNVNDTLTSCNTINVYYNKTSAFENRTSGSNCYDNSTSYRNKFQLYYKIKGNNNWVLFNTQYGYCNDNSYSASYTIPDIGPGEIKFSVIGRYNTYTSSSAPIYWQDSTEYLPVKSPSGDIQVLTPNGGEVLNALTPYNISWNANGTSGFFDVQYGTNGVSFGTIAGATNINGNSFNWTVPNSPGTRYIRVRDNQNHCIKDNSDTSFTIVAAQPVVTSPNGGEVWKVNSNQTITWDASTFYTSVYIEYSTDGGTNWNIVVSSTSNDGSHTWAVPNNLTTQALIRISNVGNPSLFDVSDAPFTINLPTPLLTYPNGGETLRSGNTYSVTWNSSTVASNVQLQYSLNNGTSWGTITNSTTNNGTRSWVIPKVATTTEALVRIINTSFPSAIDTSDAVFTILAPITIYNPVNVNDTLTSCNTINVYYNKTSAFENRTSGSNCYDNSTSYRNKFQLYYKIKGNNNWVLFNTQYGYCNDNSYSASYTIPDIGPGEIKFSVIGRYNTYTSSSAPIYWQDSTEYLPVKSPSGDIQVLTPNGGEVLNALTPYNITWNANGTSGFFDVQYGTNGVSFGTLAGATNINGNSFNWTVPNSPGTRYIRVRDNQNHCIKDNSDTSFTIVAAQPVVTSPNGGEVWKVNSNQTITWDASTFYTSVYIEYSTDGGTNWNIVVSSTSNDGSHTWAVPNNLTTQALIRISNVGNPSLFDVSDAPFTINLPTPLLTYPNGGETLRSGNTYSVTWNSSTVASNVKLEYSLNNGVSWGVITNSTTNNGSRSWVIPKVATTTEALVRIINTSFPGAIDTSDAVFTILAPITIYNPVNSNDTLTSCSTINVFYNKTSAFENRTSGSNCYDNSTSYRNKFQLYYKINGNNTWVLFNTQYGYCNDNSYYASYTIPDIGPGEIKFLVIGRYNTYTSSSAPIYWQDSTAYLPVKSPSGDIEVLTPNGGEVLNALTPYNITWNANGTSGFFDVQYGTNGVSFGTLAGATNINGNSFNWTVPNSPGTRYIRVRDNQNHCIKDNSDSAFTIVAAQPVVTSPNGGEVWKVNSNQTITWDASTFYTSVYIEYSTDGGTNWNIVVSSTSNDGSHTWAVPNNLTTQALIRISNVGNPSLFDVSDAPFTINLPTPLLTYPNGGETLRSGNTYSVTWNSSTVASNVKLEYSLNNGVSWGVITNSTTNNGSRSWVIPKVATTTEALVRIINTSFPGAIDTSDAVFTILAPITIYNPVNSNDTLTSCSTINVFYNKTSAFENRTSGSNCYDNSTSYRNKFQLYYKINGNNTWVLFNTQYGYCNDNSYYASYTIPDIGPGEIKFLVVGRYNTYTSSSAPIYWQDSTAYLPVKSPSGDIEVLTPNGGEVLNALTPYNITWNANGTSGFFDVQYGTNGVSFGTLAGATNINGNSFNWTVPNSPGTRYIRVRDNQNHCIKDNSDSAFTIVAAQPVVTSPNGGEVWKVNSNQTITWDASTFYTSVYIEYSTDGGTNWNIVVSSTSNDGSHTWAVPNNLTTQALIRISNVGNPSLFDVSDAPFTINLPTPLLTYPNGGETLRSGNTYSVTWNSSTVASNVKLEYSLNNGVSWGVITNSTTNNGSRSWVIPKVATTTEALVRIINTSFPGAIDTSDAVFTILAPITIYNPVNSNDTLTSCSTINVFYNKTSAFENRTSGSNCYDNSTSYRNKFQLYYKINGNNTWVLFNTQYGYCNDNSYYASYTIPDIGPGEIKFLVVGRYNTYTSSSAPIYWQDSTAYLPVKSPSGDIEVLTPNGGEVLNALTPYNITWNANGTSGFFDVQYGTNGVSFGTLAGATNINGNSFNWTVPNSPGTRYIRVRDNQNHCIKDNSDAAFTIIAAQPVLTSPNGGEVWNVSSNRTITWNSATLYTSVFIEYSIDNGLTWNTVVSSTSNDGSHTWSVPFNPSIQALIRISNVGNPSLSDQSDSEFTIQIPTPVLTAPNGGETWYAGTQHTITWETNSIFDNTVNLSYSLDNGVNWITIINNTNNDGSHNWTIPNVNSDQALIRVSNNSNTSYYDVNNALFTLRPYVRITNPNGGNELGACTQTTISFEKAPAYTSFNIKYSIDNGTTWIAIQNNVSAFSTFNNYNWTVPNTPTDFALVRVEPTSSLSLGDESNTTFKIKKAVSIIQPNFGGVLQIGSLYPVKWQSDGISNIYDIAYSTTGPLGPWLNIVLGYNTATNTYNWSVPNTASTNCYLRVRDNINNCKEAISDVPFTISTTANPITVLTPNGADSLNACQSYNITWTEVGGPIGSYNFAYSIDNSVNWIPITTNYATTSYNYSWIVPNINSSNVLVRVQSAPNPALFDISDALFNIIPGNLETNNDTTICSGTSVQLNTTGGSSYIWSPNTGLSNPNIANPIATPTATTQYIVSSISGGCSFNDTVLITVNPNSGASASVTITPSPSTAVCNASNVSFTANPVNGGTTPSYQWRVNGVDVGSNSSIYSTNSLTTNDVVSCVMTSSASCVQGSPASSNSVTMTVFSNVTPSVGISTAATTICSGTNVTFSATATNGGGNPTYQWKRNGLVISGANSATYTTNTIANNDVISVDMVSNANCASPLNVSSNSILMTVNPNYTPTISITADANSICAGQAVLFTANASGAGSSPVFQWRKNGVDVGMNSNTYSSSTLANNDVITCSVTSSATCNSINTVTSNSVTMSVSSSIVPAVNIIANTTNVCAGTIINFTATPTNGGTTPSYQWKVNGINAGSNSNTYSSNTLNNQDTVTCVMTSSSSCAAPLIGVSNKIGVEINPTTAPTVVAVSSSSSICAGSNVTFTANVQDAGSAPIYQWKLNSANVGGNSMTYSTSSLVNNDTIWCIVTSSSSCAVPNSSISNKLVTTVNAVVTPSISITVNNNNVCESSSVIFTANSTNGGNNPMYQWKVNGTDVGTNSASYGSTSLSNNDIVSCVLTSNVACATTTMASSNAITMTVTPASSPTVMVSATSTTICSGTPVTFNTTTLNGGGSPAYQWVKNGVNIIGANSSSYSSSLLVNSDAISCIVTSTANCAAPATANSNVVNMIVNTSVNPSISISVSSQSICTGNTANFVATPVDAGTAPTYQWKVNGTNVGTSSPAYSSNSIVDGDVVTCEMVSNTSCASTTNVSSNTLTMAVNTAVTPSVSITSSATSICSGTLVTFSSTVTNGGGSPSFVWKNNGVTIVSANAASYSSTTLADNDVITVELTSSAPCSSPAIVGSNPIAIAVTPSVTPTISISASSTSVCAGSVTFTASAANGGSSPVYQWKINGSNVGTNANLFTSSTLNDGDVVTCTLTSNASCASSTIVNSNSITMSVTTPAAPIVVVSASANNVCEGTSVIFTTNVMNAGTSPVYQWKVNGSNVGTSSSSFTSSILVNGDIVSCQFSSVNACSGSNTVNSNSITMILESEVTPTVSISSSSMSICSGTSVSFTATATNEGTVPMYQWKVNGVDEGTNSSTYASSTLANNDIVTCILTSNANCVSSSTANSNAITMSVGSNATPTVGITSSASSICTGTNVTFNAMATNGGSIPVYQWKLNGANVGTNSTSYASSSLANGDVVSCVLTSTANCVSSSTANSNAITIIVNTAVTPSVVMSASSTSICSGDMINFNATATNGGTTPVYQWKLNGNDVGTNSSSYSNAALNSGDVVTVVMTSSITCTSIPTATANPVTITVNPSATPTVSINASQTTVCSGSPIMFTASVTNEGSNPVYEWYRNSTLVGTNSATLNISTLSNGDVITCELTSDVACASSTNVTSNGITVTVNNSISASVSITGSASSICAGETVNFTAAATNGGSSPVYQWKVNGANVGTNSAMFTSNTLTNGDVVSCSMTSNAACASPSIASSNSLTMIVNVAVTPLVVMTASSTSICSGEMVNFNATATNGGTTPTYQWKLNGNDVGTNSSIYSNAALNSGDVVTVVMTSSLTCTSVPTATANPVTISINPSAIPTVSISTSSMSICSGTSVSFTATAINEGTVPMYQWKVNGVDVGANSSTYASSTLANNDIVTCILTSNANCVSSSTANSNAITMSVGSNATPTVGITSSASSICTGTNVTFNAMATNGGSIPVYQWKLNGANVGTNSTSYASSSLANGDVVSCVLTSNANCVSSSTANSNAITIIVNTAVTPLVVMSASSTSICSGDMINFNATATNGGTTPVYQWKLNGNDVGTNSSSYSNAALNSGDVVTVVMTSSITCTSIPTATANPVTITVNPSATPTVSINASQTTVCSGSPIMFTASVTNEGSNPVYEWYRNSTLVGTNSATLNISTLSNGDVITCELTSDVACASSTNVTSNGITVTVNNSISASVSITGSASSICVGETVNFTAAATNGGSSPVYQWKVNGAITGTNSAMFASNTLTNGDVVSCTLISSAACVSMATVQSNNLTISELPTTTPTLSIASSATSICTGELATFTATANNAGSTPSYQWTLNGNNVGTNSTAYSNSTLNNGDVVSLVMTSSALCNTSPTATASPITLTVNSASTPDVAIVSNTNSVCAGSPVQFTATSIVAGNSPIYQWQVNGANVSTGTTFTSSTLANGDMVTCVLNTSGACVSPNSATSNVITINVSPVVVPTISISASSTAFCSGTSVNFTASVTNEGTAPNYQWQVNGMNIATGSVFNSNSLNDGDIVSCTLTSNANCANPTVVSSSAITVSVSSPSTPSVTIATSTSSICSGDFAAFTAIPTNGGSSPVYQWKLNGANVGTNSSSYSSATLNNTDVVTVDMTSSSACSSVATVTANPVVMMVNTAATPDVMISTSSNNVCSGASVTFTATSIVAGSNPTYQWQVNNLNVTTGLTFTSSTLLDGDDVSCVLTTSGNCLSSSTANSNVIAMTVGQTVTPSISIVSDDTSVCAGTEITFTTTVTNAGPTPSYIWKVNGVSTGETSASFVSSSLNNNDAVTCEMSSSLNCVSSNTVSSNAIVVSITPLETPSVIISASDAAICAGTTLQFIAIPTNGGTSPDYQWNVNGIDMGMNSNIYNTDSLSNGDVVNVTLTATGACTNPNIVSGNPITILVSDTSSPIVSITASPSTTICSGTTVNFVANPINGGSAPAYQWKVNGDVVGTNSSVFTSDELSQSDVVTCSMTSNLNCSNNNTASSNVLTMEVSDSPTQPVVTTNSPICEGEKLVLASAMIAGATYEWSGPNAATYSTNEITIENANTSHAGTYVLTISLNSCSSSSDPIPVAVNPNPIQPNITANGNLLTSSTAPNYQWMVNNSFITNETNNSITANQSGDYQVRVSNSFGCHMTSESISIIISSVNDVLGKLKGVSVYPNPVETFTQISIDNSILSLSNWTYSITDVNGRILEFDRKLNYENTLNWSEWADGVYFINVSDGKNYKTFKLIKVRK